MYPRWARTGVAALVVCLASSGATLLAAPEAYIPKTPTRWVTDTASFLSPEARQALDGRLEAYERSSGNQFLIWIGPTSAPTTPEEFAVRAFAKWGVGQKDKLNGLVLFVFAEDRKIKFEVGYGLEDRLPDAVASRIIREVATPQLQAGKRDAAITAAAEAAIGVLGGQPLGSAGGDALTGSAPHARQRPSKPLSVTQIIFFGVIAIGFLILLVTNPRLAIWLLVNALASGGRGGGSGGGGGWSGGGGRSGGGGASGSW